MTGLRFDPALPLWLIGAIAALAVLVALFAVWRGLRGWALRGLALLAVAAALAGPAIEQGQRSSLSDIVIMVEDRSASQSLPGRADQTDAAVDALAAQIGALPGTELRRITVGDDPDGSLIGAALARAIAAEPADRLAGAIVVSDGLAHDAPMLPADAPAPVHLLMTGQPQDWDRRLVIEEAPAFGIIGEAVNIRLRIEDEGAVPDSVAGRPATLRISLDGGAPQVVAMPPGQPVDLSVTLDHAGQNVVQIGFDAPQAGAGAVAELTDRNNAAAISVTGVRDRLRVLLVSGEPHAGERTWRNLLKSDAGVDLIHFTILRPPEKSDAVPVNEMALIAFPTRELFLERIDDFDLIIFDRYRVRGILPPDYFDNIVRYVQQGGAILVAAGPEMSGVESLNLSPLGQILPARPTGRVIETPFLPELTDTGRRHPVTSDLPGAPAADGDDGDHWGRWLRMSDTVAQRGQVAMEGAEGRPLLILDRVGEGRVGQLTSDQVWLWGRGFEGGGPQQELLRRIAHWSMAEPELEEEALTADVLDGLTLRITRRSLADRVGPVTVTGPDGDTATVTLTETTPGRFTAEWDAPGPGLYRLREGDLERVVALGPAAPLEFRQTVANGTAFAALAGATGGAVLPLSAGLPDLRQVRADRPAFGDAVGGPWIGITPREAFTLTGLTRRALLPLWAWLLIAAGLAIAAWLIEGRMQGGGGRTGAARADDRDDPVASASRG